MGGDTPTPGPPIVRTDPVRAAARRVLVNDTELTTWAAIRAESTQYLSRKNSYAPLFCAITGRHRPSTLDNPIGPFRLQWAQRFLRHPIGHSQISAAIDQLGPLAPQERGPGPALGGVTPSLRFEGIRPGIFCAQMRCTRRLRTSVNYILYLDD